MLGCLSSCSYIKPQPICSEWRSRFCCLSSCSYIKPQHRNTKGQFTVGCLSSCSYIKPQQYEQRQADPNVVYHLVPTSNHNYSCRFVGRRGLFIILFLHQTTTLVVLVNLHLSCLSSCSYIKPQQVTVPEHFGLGCLSSCSYIKPQPILTKGGRGGVVYHLVPTSNHNQLQRSRNTR